MLIAFCTFLLFVNCFDDFILTALGQHSVFIDYYHNGMRLIMSAISPEFVFLESEPRF